MHDQNQTILVPCDFSTLNDYAFHHAVEISKVTENDITLLHVIKKESEINAARENMEKLLEKYKQEFGIAPSYRIDKGNIYKTISSVASKELNTSLAVMKTSGETGKYSLSHPLKIMLGSKVPFIVVQRPPRKGTVEKVVSPIDFRTENKEKTNWLIFLSKYYKCKFYLYKPEHKDSLLNRNIRNNLRFTTQVLDKKEIDYEIVTSKGGGDFNIKMLEFANSIDSDLIILLLNKNRGLLSFLSGMKEQEVVANKYKIPVMCVNPRADLRKYGGFH